MRRTVPSNQSISTSNYYLTYLCTHNRATRLVIRSPGSIVWADATHSTLKIFNNILFPGQVPSSAFPMSLPPWNKSKNCCQGCARDAEQQSGTHHWPSSSLLRTRQAWTLFPKSCPSRHYFICDTDSRWHWGRHPATWAALIHSFTHSLIRSLSQSMAHIQGTYD